MSPAIVLSEVLGMFVNTLSADGIIPLRIVRNSNF